MPNTEEWNISHEMFDALESEEQRLRFLMRYAMRASASHAGEPWTFQISQNHITLTPDLEHAIEVGDSEHRQVHIGMGAALENLLVAAAYFGYTTDVSYRLGNIAGTEECVVVFSEHDETKTRGDTRLIAAILQPHENRDPYDHTLPAQAYLEKIRALSSESVQVDLVMDEIKKERIADIVVRAGIAALAQPAMQADIGQFFKNTVSGAPLGMPALGMRFPAPLSPLLPLAITFVNINKLREKQDRALLSKHTSLMLVVSTPHDTPEYWVRAGVCFERIALETVADHMRVHQLSAAIQIDDYCQELQQVIGLKGARPQLLCRIGYARGNAAHDA